MTIEYTPQGVCSHTIQVELEQEIITSIQVLGGCQGNSQGISKLLTGMRAGDAIEKLRGIRCGSKETSCPDQVSRALERALAQQRTA